MDISFVAAPRVDSANFSCGFCKLLVWIFAEGREVWRGCCRAAGLKNGLGFCGFLQRNASFLLRNVNFFVETGL